MEAGHEQEQALPSSWDGYTNMLKLELTKMDRLRLSIIS
jgi:hypothetical protein